VNGEPNAGTGVNTLLQEKPNVVDDGESIK
jgi:hypothetical protein